MKTLEPLVLVQGAPCGGSVRGYAPRQMYRPSHRRARRRNSVVLVVMVLAGIGLGLGLSVWAQGGSTPPPTTSAPPTTPPPTTTTTEATPSVPGAYRVGTTSITVVESSTRSLPTGVWYPSATGTGGSLHGAHFPLLVFSQGYDLSVSAYADLITAWASAGYVVVAPTYPDTAPTSPTLNESDIVNHPGDLKSVITTVLQLAGQAGSVLAAVNTGEIGLVGHSDGGDVSLTVAENSAYQDPRVKAVAVLSGAELASFGGTYFGGATVPLLAVQGSADTINPPGCSVQFYTQAPEPKYYLDLLGAQHEPPYTVAGSPAEQVVARVTTEFFDAELAGNKTAASAMATAGNQAGVSQFYPGTPPPVATGCPGAPGGGAY